MAEPEDEAPPVLLPCSFCTRTFKPETLEKHIKVCEKQATKKRKVFDSSKQRIQGTELAEYLPKILREKKNERVVIKKTESNWKEKHLEFVASIRAARGVEHSATTTSAVSKSSNEKCPHCDRNFGPKAFDRHIEWCKEQKARIPKSPANLIQAKERLEARTKYRAPPLAKSKRTLTREKYARVYSSKETSPLGCRSALTFSKQQSQDVKSLDTTSRAQGVKNKPKLSLSSPSCTLPSGNLPVKRRESSPSPTKKNVKSNIQRKSTLPSKNEEPNYNASLFPSSCNITKMKPSNERRRGKEVKPAPVENRPCTQKASHPLLMVHRRHAESAKHPAVFGTHSSKCEGEIKHGSIYPTNRELHHEDTQELLLVESLQVKESLTDLEEVGPMCDSRKRLYLKFPNSKREKMKLNNIEVNKEVDGLLVSPCSIYSLNSSSDASKENAKEKERGDSDKGNDDCSTTFLVSSFTDNDIQTCKTVNGSSELENRSKHFSSGVKMTSNAELHKKEFKLCVDSPQCIFGDSIYKRELKESKSVSSLNSPQIQIGVSYLEPSHLEIPIISELIECSDVQVNISGLSHISDDREKSINKDKDFLAHPKRSSVRERKEKDIDSLLHFENTKSPLKDGGEEKKVKENLNRQDISLPKAIQKINLLPNTVCGSNKLQIDSRKKEITNRQKLSNEAKSQISCCLTFSDDEFDEDCNMESNSSVLNDIIYDKQILDIGDKQLSSSKLTSPSFMSSPNSRWSTNIESLVYVSEVKPVDENYYIATPGKISDCKESAFSNSQNNLSFKRDLKNTKGFTEEEKTKSKLQEKSPHQEKIHDRTFSVNDFKTCDPSTNNELNINSNNQTQVNPNYFTENKDEFSGATVDLSFMDCNEYPDSQLCDLKSNVKEVQISRNVKHSKMPCALVELNLNSNMLPVYLKNSADSESELIIKENSKKTETSQLCKTKLNQLENNLHNLGTVALATYDNFHTLNSDSLDVPNISLWYNAPDHQHKIQSVISEQIIDGASETEMNLLDSSSVLGQKERNIFSRFCQTADKVISTNINCKNLDSCLLESHLGGEEIIKEKNYSVSVDTIYEEAVNKQSTSGGRCVHNLKKVENCCSLYEVNEIERNSVQRLNCTGGSNYSSCKKVSISCYEKHEIPQQKEIQAQPRSEEEDFNYFDKCDLFDTTPCDRYIDSQTDRIWDLASQEFHRSLNKSSSSITCKSFVPTEPHSNAQENEIAGENDTFELCRKPFNVSCKMRHNYAKTSNSVTPNLLRARYSVGKSKNKANFQKFHSSNKKQRKIFLKGEKAFDETGEPLVKKRLLHNLCAHCDFFQVSFACPTFRYKRMIQGCSLNPVSLCSENLNINLENECNITFESNKLIIPNLNVKNRLSGKYSENILPYKLSHQENNNSLYSVYWICENTSISESNINIFYRPSYKNESNYLISRNEDIVPYKSFYQNGNKEFAVATKMQPVFERRNLLLLFPKVYMSRTDPSVFLAAFDVIKNHEIIQLLFSIFLRYLIFVHCGNNYSSFKNDFRFEDFVSQIHHFPKKTMGNYHAIEFECSKKKQNDFNEISTFDKKNYIESTSENEFISEDSVEENEFLIVNYPCMKNCLDESGLLEATRKQEKLEKYERIVGDSIQWTHNYCFTSSKIVPSSSSFDREINYDFIRESETHVSVKGKGYGGCNSYCKIPPKCVCVSESYPDLSNGYTCHPFEYLDNSYSKSELYPCNSDHRERQFRREHFNGKQRITEALVSSKDLPVHNPHELNKLYKLLDKNSSKEMILSSSSNSEPWANEDSSSKYIEETFKSEKNSCQKMYSSEVLPVNFHVQSEINVISAEVQEFKTAESIMLSSTGSNTTVPEFLTVSNLFCHQNNLQKKKSGEIQFLENCVFSLCLPTFLFNDNDKKEELNVKVWTCSIKIPPKNSDLITELPQSSCDNSSKHENPLKKYAFQERLAENMCLMQQNSDNLFEFSEIRISSNNSFNNSFQLSSTEDFKKARKNISDSNCNGLTDSKKEIRTKRLRSNMSLYDLALSTRRDRIITQSSTVSLPEISGHIKKRHTIKSAEEHDKSFLKLVEKWTSRSTLLKRAARSVEAANNKNSKDYIQQIPQACTLPPLSSRPKCSSQSSPEPRVFPSSKSHFEKGDADKRIAEDPYNLLKCDSSACGEFFNQPKSYSAGAKFSADSAYGSLNRRSPTLSANQMPSKHEDLEGDRMCFMSSSSSESSLPPLCSLQGTKGDASNPSLSPTSSCAVDASPDMQNVPRMSKFCHECGSKFPVSLAKFCCECGVRRLAM